VILGLGVDLFEVARLERELGAHDPGFGPQLFTPGEIAYCEGQRHPAQHYAARFAAKEAAFKALVLVVRDGAHWQEAEVQIAPDGTRQLVLHGRLEDLAKRRGVARVLLSLSHTRTLATASVVLES